MNIIKPVKQGIITSGYGQRKINGILQFHTGIDIGVKSNPVNVPVFCVKEGIISWYDDNPSTSGGFGKVIYINILGNWYSVYAHLNLLSFDLKFGSIIKAGEFIGIMGSTGQSTAIHLHYEERFTMLPGKSRNPTDVYSLFL